MGPSPRKIFDTINYFVQPLIAIAVFYIAILQYEQAQEQSQMSKVQTEIAIAQETLDLHMFVREYLNGFVYLYDVVNAESVKASIKEIRAANLPALAVPSQYSGSTWLIITHSFGQFNDLRSAEKEILAWRQNHINWDYGDKPKTYLFEKYRKKQQAKGVAQLVFYYKADIITYKDYFERLASSKDFSAALR